MDTERPVIARKRLVALLAVTVETLAAAVARLERQRHTVQWLEQRGYPSGLARSLFMRIAEIVVTLRCQEAWIEQHLRETGHLDLESQPLPLEEPTPPYLRPRIRAELLLLVHPEEALAKTVANDALIEAAVTRVLGRE